LSAASSVREAATAKSSDEVLCLSQLDVESRGPAYHVGRPKFDVITSAEYVLGLLYTERVLLFVNDYLILFLLAYLLSRCPFFTALNSL